MQSPPFPAALGPALSSALQRKGFTELTAVQTAVLDPELSGRELRITSQTGSGKTVAIGFVLREEVERAAADSGPEGAAPGASGAGGKGRGLAYPAALVVAPTRE